MGCVKIVTISFITKKRKKLIFRTLMSLTLQVACVLEREKEKTLIVRILIDLILQEACVKYALERVITLRKK
jgi:hypothetical protein